MNEDIKNFHLPRWDELPNIDLYIDQLVSFLEQYLAGYIKNDNEKEEKIITKTMINNYVKHKAIKAPVNKKYNKEHMASLFVIFILKEVYSIHEIEKLISLAIETSPIELAYDRFCSELEKAIRIVFAEKNYVKNSRLSQEQYILRNVVQSFANKLYVQRVYLKK
jgi:methyltransferase-like protein